ncbi:MAG: 3-hydroxyacyl-CoA dehydrogenase family protein [Planctomycetota bacterium]|jgi:3-hydroxybutyryl-CoA dehydrogenase|nr:3-hydroxyacyl-CoA dehydrogenase family protein [Planctomycetota bacterium]
MNSKQPSTFAVVGLGKMGLDWIVQILEGGHEVIGFDIQEASRESAPKIVQASLDWVGRKRHPETEDFATQALSRFQVAPNEEAFQKALNDSQILFEVVFEDLRLKCDLLARLTPSLPSDAMIWTNTSSLSIARMAHASGRPSKVVGAHGMNPVYRMPGVEVIRHEEIDSETLKNTVRLIEQMGKIPFIASDVTGFWVNKLLVPFTLDAIRALERGEISVEDGDKGLHLCLGHPQGVFKLADFIGLDTMYRVSVAMYLDSQDPRYYPPALLTRLFKEGSFGVKSGRGFYSWEKSRCKGPRDFSNQLLDSPGKILSI